MEEKQKTLSATGFSGKYLVASLFILSGILLFARNMGWITAELFSTIVSWYSLFIILGIYSMIRRHFVGGIILLLIGVYFLLGGLSWLRLCQNADTAFFYAQSPDFLKPGLCYYPKFSYL